MGYADDPCRLIWSHDLGPRLMVVGRVYPGVSGEGPISASPTLGSILLGTPGIPFSTSDQSLALEEAKCG